MMPQSTSLAIAAVVLVGAGATPAFSQEAPLWQGFYIGANAGGAWGDQKVSASVEPGNGTAPISAIDAAAISRASADKGNKGGFTGGVQGGYNYMMGPWLLGLEADWEWLDVNTTSSKSVQSALLISPPLVYNLNQRVSTDWMVTLRPRVGYAFDNWLIYGTGGFAWSQLKYRAEISDNRGNRASTDTSSTKTGWAAGVGAGYAITSQWSARGEWLYADFGHVGSATTNSFATIRPNDSVKTNIVRVGVDYRF
jgi:outer membrane immunogenic protein